jgi:hypothetical protein
MLLKGILNESKMMENGNKMEKTERKKERQKERKKRRRTKWEIETERR